MVEALLEMEGIEKSFPGVRALAEVSLTLGEGEVLALMGENGAGKSTLIKVLGGAQGADAGKLRIRGEEVRFSKPAEAVEAGVAIIHQEFNLIPGLTVRENVFLGREKTGRWGLTDARSEIEEVWRIFERMGVSIDPEERCDRLPVAQQQLVEIAKALSTNARILVMDEPTAALSGVEVDQLLEITRELAGEGMGVIYVSHRLEEIFAVADRVVVLRDGRSVGEAKIDEIDREGLIELMVGRSFDQEFPRREVVKGGERLRVEGLRREGVVEDVSFSLHCGEVLGLAGLVGAGRTETARLIFGADRGEGKLFLNGQEVSFASPCDAIRSGVCLLTEDRKGQGLVLVHSVQENFGLPNLRSFQKRILLDERAEREEFESYVGKLSIKVSSPEQAAGNLSGGNQQKLVLSKWLARNAEVFIFDEPTRGVDVGAKYEIYLLINQLVAEGKAVLFISSDLPEVIGMCDRVIVMHEGKVTGEIEDLEGTTQEDILSLAI